MARQVALVGNRLSLVEKPRSWRTRFIRSAESSRSWMVKAGSNPIWGAYSRSSRAPMAWKVPAQRAGQRGSRDCAVRPECLIADALDPPRHLDSGTARERHQQDAAGIDVVGGEMHHPMGERAGLAP